MDAKKFLGFALFVGFQGALAQIIDNVIIASGMLPEGAVGFSWVAFLAWATYFFSGCNAAGGIKAFLCFALGILTGVGIIEIGVRLPMLGSYAFPVAIVVVVTVCMYLEKVPPVNSIAAIFIGCGTFFGFMNYVPNATYGYVTGIIMGYGLIGLVSGYISIVFRVWYEKKFCGPRETVEKAS